MRRMNKLSPNMPTADKAVFVSRTKFPVLLRESLARRQPCCVLWLQYKKFSVLTKLRSTLKCEISIQEKAKITDNADAYR